MKKKTVIKKSSKKAPVKAKAAQPVKEAKPEKVTDAGKEDLGSIMNSLAAAMKEAEKIQFDDQIKFPIEVKSLNTKGGFGFQPGFLSRGKTGGFVAIRPVAKEYEGKTFLGIYLGDTPISGFFGYHPEKQELTFYTKTNPAIFVMDLNKVIFGAESWWGPIKSHEHLKQITDGDIQNVWYVKALKQLEEAAK